MRPLMDMDGQEVVNRDLAKLNALVDSMTVTTAIGVPKLQELDELLKTVTSAKDLKITDLQKKAEAEQIGVAAQKLIKLAKETFAPYKRYWKAVYDDFRDTEGRYTEAGEHVKSLMADQIRQYIKAVEAKEREQMQAREQQQALAAFSLEDQPDPSSALDIAMPTVQASSIARTSISGAKVGATPRLVPEVDLRQLIMECARRLEKGDESMLPFLAVNDKACRNAVSTYGVTVSTMYPGISAVNHDRVAFRT